MRTTIDLPPDLHALAKQLARESNRSMNEVIVELVRSGLHRVRADMQSTDRGLPQVSVGRRIAAEDVRSLDDEA